MKLIFSIFCFGLLSNVAFANEKGFLLDGKAHVVFKDGKKVGKTYEEMFPAPKDGRAPNATKALIAVVQFEDDASMGVRCYRFTQSVGYDALSCVQTRH